MLQWLALFSYMEFPFKFCPNPIWGQPQTKAVPNCTLTVLLDWPKKGPGKHHCPVMLAVLSEVENAILWDPGCVPNILQTIVPKYRSTAAHILSSASNPEILNGT